MTDEEQYLKTFDLDEEFKEFCKRYDMLDNFDRLEELKEKFIDCAMSTFFMDRIHNDYKKMYEKYYGEYKKVLKENVELKSFIERLKKFITNVKFENIDNNFLHFFELSVTLEYGRFYMLLASDSVIKEILDNERL